MIVQLRSKFLYTKTKLDFDIDRYLKFLLNNPFCMPLTNLYRLAVKLVRCLE